MQVGVRGLNKDLVMCGLKSTVERQTLMQNGEALNYGDLDS